MFVFGSKILANMRQRRRASHFCKACVFIIIPAGQAGDGYTGLHTCYINYISQIGNFSYKGAAARPLKFKRRHGPGRVHGGVLYMQWLWNFISK